MPIAFSRSAIIDTTADGTTVALLRAGLHTALTDAGWSATGVTGGYKFTFTSRQDLTAACWIRDEGLTIFGYPCLSVQFGSEDGGHMGRVHLLVASAHREAYQVVANHCQMFVSLTGKYYLGPDAEATPFNPA